MTEKNEATETAESVLGGKKSTGRLSISPEDLQNLVAAAVGNAVNAALDKSSKGFEALAEAILKSREPYKAPGQEENEKAMRASMRAQREDAERALKADRDACSHVQGGHPRSDFPNPYGLTSIIHHYLDTGEVIGLCTICGKVFQTEDPEKRDPEFERWMSKKSANKPSSSGRRTFRDPIKAIKSGRLVDQP